MNKLSLIIPIHNEEAILTRQIKKAVQALQQYNTIFEIILIENGSRDNTYKLAQQLKINYSYITLIQLSDAHYGEALKAGILNATYDGIIQCDLDFIDQNFIKRAVQLLDDYDIVIGSKLLADSQDNRPWYRTIFTTIFHQLIRIFFGYNGDTHGIKAYRKNAIKPLAMNIQPTQHLFDTELILRAFHTGYRITEIPINITEIRFSRFEYRTIQAIQNLFILISKRHEITKH